MFAPDVSNGGTHFVIDKAHAYQTSKVFQQLWMRHESAATEDTLDCSHTTV